MAKHKFKDLIKEQFGKNTKKEKNKRDSKDKKNDKFDVSVTHHVVYINGKPLRYTARAGIWKMLDSKGKHKSHIFFVSYEKDIPSDKKDSRPITFAFNGGPGAASVWVHFGALGPKRVKMTPNGDFIPPPFSFENNDYTWLDFTDLVFIDPVGTGFSGHPNDEDPKQFWGVKEDIESVGEFIRLYITRQQRWMSPKFIAGESYGSTRAAGLAGQLQDKLGIDLSGIILISSVLDFSTISFSVGNDLPYALFVPSYTATAHYHNRLNNRLQDNLEKTLEEVEKWVLSEYIPALAYGNSLPSDKHEEIAKKLAEYTGLSELYVKRCNLRVDAFRYRKELMRDDYLTVGRLDTRFKGMDSDSAGEYPEFDPSLAAGSFTASISDFIRGKLKYKNETPYLYSNPNVSKNWNWKSIDKFGYACVADILREEIHKNQFLNVLVVCGYYDIGTPYFAMKYTVDHLKLDPSLRDNVSIAYYKAGHMVYYPLDMLIKFTKDVKNFVQKSIIKYS